MALLPFAEGIVKGCSLSFFNFFIRMLSLTKPINVALEMKLAVHSLMFRNVKHFRLANSFRLLPYYHCGTLQLWFQNFHLLLLVLAAYLNAVCLPANCVKRDLFETTIGGVNRVIKILALLLYSYVLLGFRGLVKRAERTSVYILF